MPDEQQQKQDQQDPAAELAALKTQMAERDAQLGEQRQAAQYWHGKAQEVLKPKPAAAAADADLDDDVDLLEVITTKGTKGLKAMLAKAGFVSADDVDKKVNATVARITKEAQLAKEYPELSDPKSDFFKETAQAYGEYKKAGVSDELAMEMAAGKTELAFLRSGKMQTPSEKKAATAAARKVRAAAGEGVSGGRPSEGSDEDADLDDDQRLIAIAMLAGLEGADGKPMTHEQAIETYTKRAKGGVNMSLKGKR